jgi:hypothetical protein
VTYAREHAAPADLIEHARATQAALERWAAMPAIADASDAPNGG